MTNNTANEPNYFETVAVPTLQRKCQELYNSNLALEISLHMEIAQAKDLIEEVSKLKSAQSASSSDVISLNEQLTVATKRYETAENDYRNLQISFNDKGNALSSAQHRIIALENEIAASRSALQSLQEELQSAKNQLIETQRKFNKLSVSAKALNSPAAKSTKPKVIAPTDDF